MIIVVGMKVVFVSLIFNMVVILCNWKGVGKFCVCYYDVILDWVFSLWIISCDVWVVDWFYW